MVPLDAGFRVEVKVIGREVSTEPSCVVLVPVVMSGRRRGVWADVSGLVVVGPPEDGLAPGRR